MNSQEKLLNQINKFILCINQDELNIPNIITEITKFIAIQLNFSNVYCFDIYESTYLKIHNLFPSDHNKSGLSIKLKSIPIFHEAIQNKKILFSDEIDKTSDVLAILNSYFNLSVKSFVIFPIFFQMQLELLIVAISSKTDKIAPEAKWIIHILKSFLETSFRRYYWEGGELSNYLIYPSESNEILFFKSLLDQLNFGILVVNADLNIQYMNRESSTLLRLPKNLQKVPNIKDILGKHNINTILNTLKDPSSTFERPEIELVSEEGNKILIGFTVTPILGTKKQVNGYILLLKDITYSKELQEEMQRMDRLASLGVMISGIAHEVRNPLAGIKAIAQTFEDDLSKNDPKREYVERIIKQVNRLEDLLKSLFSYAKPQKPNRQFHSIEEILQEVLTLLNQKIKNQNVKLMQYYEKNIPLIFVDNSQIQQVLFNIILNSIEAIENIGEINIRVENLDGEKSLLSKKPFLLNHLQKKFVHILVSDNGCGITQENLQQIFNPFFTTKSFGTGLGLSIVYQIIQENNGMIFFESQPHKGTDCHLLLPAFNQIEGKNR